MMAQVPIMHNAQAPLKRTKAPFRRSLRLKQGCLDAQRPHTRNKRFIEIAPRLIAHALDGTLHTCSSKQHAREGGVPVGLCLQLIYRPTELSEVGTDPAFAMSSYRRSAH